MKLFAMLLLVAGLPLVAQAEDTAPGCVEASVGGYKAPDYGCLSRQMGNDPQAAKAARKPGEALNKGVDQRAPNQVGLATPAATRVRMGNTFGTSVTPQRR